MSGGRQLVRLVARVGRLTAALQPFLASMRSGNV